MLDNVPSEHLPDICASIVKSSVSEKIQVLDAIDLSERFKKTLPLLIRQIEVRLLPTAFCRMRGVNVYTGVCPRGEGGGRVPIQRGSIL